MATCNYGGLITAYKNTIYNKELLFNVKNNVDAQTTTFDVDIDPVILTGDNVNASGIVCGGIAPNCVSYDDRTITADFQIGMNEIFPKCIDQTTAEKKASKAKRGATMWANTEVTYGYSVIVPKFDDLTEEMSDNVRTNGVKAEAIYMIEKMVEKGYSEDQLVLVLGSKAKYEDLLDELGCCDIGVASVTPGSIISNKLGIQGVYYITNKNVISGNIAGDTLTDETTVRMMVYVKELQPFLTYCEDDPTLEDYNDAYNKTRSHLIGDEVVGVDSWTDTDGETSGVVEYEGLPETPETV